MKKLTYICLSALLVLSSCGKGKKAGSADSSESVERVRPVKLTSVFTREFEDRLEVQGNLEAKYYANVGVKVKGVLTKIYVEAGARVKMDETPLFETETRRYAQSKRLTEQIFLVQKENLLVAEANVARAQAKYDKLKKDKERYDALYKDGNVTVNEKEQADMEYLMGEADLKLNKANYWASKARMEQAQVSFEIARNDLNDCTIIAPLTGVVTKRKMEPGEFADTGKTVVRIEGNDVLEAIANIPGIYYNKITPGKTTTRLVAEGMDAGIFPITYRADTIDNTLRTFEVKALIPNKEHTLASGMMTDMTLIMDKRKGLAVPSHCVIEREQGKVIFLIRQGKAQELVVTTGYVNDGFTEILSAKMLKDDNTYAPYTLTAGTKVIYEGQYLVVHGDRVQTAK